MKLEEELIKVIKEWSTSQLLQRNRTNRFFLTAKSQYCMVSLSTKLERKITFNSIKVKHQFLSVPMSHQEVLISRMWLGLSNTIHHLKSKSMSIEWVELQDWQLKVTLLHSSSHLSLTTSSTCRKSTK